jgi:hypothetical protein
VRWARWGREGREREVEKPAQSKKVGNIVWKVSRGQWVLAGTSAKVIRWVRKREWWSWLNAPETEVFTTSIANNEPPRTYTHGIRLLLCDVRWLRGRDCGLVVAAAVVLAAEGARAIVFAVTSAAEEDLLDLRGDYVSGAAARFRLACCSASEGGGC